MVNKNIQMRNYNGDSWDKLFPLTLFPNVFDENGNTLTQAFSTINKTIDDTVKSLPFIDVREYANKNNIDDDTVAIQEVINIVSENNIKTKVYLKGEFTTFDEINLPSDITIELHENARITRKHNGYMFKNWVDGDSFTAYGGNGNIKIIGGTLDQNGFEFPSTATCIITSHAENIIIKDVTILNGANSHHIELNACKNVVIDGCVFKGLNNVSGNSFTEAIQLDLSKIHPLPAYDNTVCSNITIQNCRFGGNVLNPIMRAIGSHSTTIGVWHENIKILNNIFENISNYAIRPYGWNNVQIKGNTLKSCGGGIIASTPNPSHDSDSTNTGGTITNESQDCVGFIVEGNEFIAGMNIGHAINFYGYSSGRNRKIIISNNVIESPNISDYVVFVRYGYNVNIHGNIIIGGKNDGIVISESYSVNIKNNTLDQIESNGIYCTTNIGALSIGGNVIRRMTLRGIYVRDNVTGLSIDNNEIIGVNGDGGSNSHIRLTTSINGVSLVGNICLNLSGYTNDIGLSITPTVSNVTRVGNHLIGFDVYDGSNSVVTGDLL